MAADQLPPPAAGAGDQELVQPERPRMARQVADLRAQNDQQAAEIDELRRTVTELTTRLGDAVTQVQQQNAHIDALHRMVDQTIAELNAEFDRDWRPDLRPERADIPNAIVTDDRTRRVRRADRFLPHAGITSSARGEEVE